jgi:hypothetical protein
MISNSLKIGKYINVHRIIAYTCQKVEITEMSISKMWHIHIMKYYSVCPTTQMNLEDIMLCEVSYSQKEID